MLLDSGLQMIKTQLTSQSEKFIKPQQMFLIFLAMQFPCRVNETDNKAI